MHDTQAMTRIERAPLRAAFAAVIACAAAALPFAASAVPVIPQAVGYGMETPAGRGGTVHRVTNLNASGAGSLRACVDASGPRVCVFEVSGTINANVDLIVRNPYITIAGQTAPSPGVMWRGGALWIATSHVLVQHMRFRAGDHAGTPDPSNRDGLKISGMSPISNIVVDHCSFSWATDENVQLWNTFDNVTVSNSIIAEGLHESINPIGFAGYGLIVGPGRARVSIIGNLLAHNYARNPYSRASEMVFVNNVVYNRAHKDVDLQSQDGIAFNTSVVGNVFIRGADYEAGNSPVRIRNDGATGLATSKVYVADNSAVEKVNDEWSIVAPDAGTLPASMKATLPPTWPSGLTRLPTDADVVLSEVLRFAGARPADRDPVDRRIVQSVRDRTGRIINCVSPNGTTRCARNAGGWPTLAQNRRTLTLPANPNTVTASGYTNLELWLHDMAAQVEGRSSKPPAPPVLATDNR